MTALHRRVRELARRNTPFTIPVIVETVRRVSAGFLRVTIGGEALDRYTDRYPADAFKLMFPPDGRGTIDPPERGADGLPHWPEGTTQPVLRAFTVRAYDPGRLRLEFDIADHPHGVTMSWLRAGPEGSSIMLAGSSRSAPGSTRTPSSVT